jgi:undecaprenyl-diphosphatase
MPGVLDAIGRLDAAVFQWLRLYHAPSIDVAMEALSDAGIGGALWVVLALMLGVFQRRRWPAVVHTLLAIGLASLLVDGVTKPFFARARPFQHQFETRVYGRRPTSSSFPSGHTADGVAGAYTLSRVAPTGRVFFWALALVMAAARIYLGVHYPFDVLGGAVIGLAAAAFVVGGTRWTYAEGKKPGSE